MISADTCWYFSNYSIKMEVQLLIYSWWFMVSELHTFLSLLTHTLNSELIELWSTVREQETQAYRVNHLRVCFLNSEFIGHASWNRALTREELSALILTTVSEKPWSYISWWLKLIFCLNSNVFPCFFNVVLYKSRNLCFNFVP